MARFAIRIAKAASALGIESVGVFSPADALSLHTRIATAAFEIGNGAADDPVGAYLDADGLIGIAKESGCDCVHPGYGFLAENAAFAQRCAEAGLTFVGPSPDALSLFGDKVRARALASSLGIPVVPGSGDAVASADDASAVASELGYPVMLKAAGGGGGRGMRVVDEPGAMAESFERCRGEAAAAFGNGDVFIEKLIDRPRHIEVQILADGEGNVLHLHERDCSVQLRNQKVIETAPAAGLDEELRNRILADAIKLMTAADYVNAGTVEFLVEPESGERYFIECNPRIQVEHTVTEQVTGLTWWRRSSTSPPRLPRIVGAWATSRPLGHPGVSRCRPASWRAGPDPECLQGTHGTRYPCRRQRLRGLRAPTAVRSAARQGNRVEFVLGGSVVFCSRGPHAAGARRVPYRRTRHEPRAAQGDSRASSGSDRRRPHDLVVRRAGVAVARRRRQWERRVGAPCSNRRRSWVYPRCPARALPRPSSQRSTHSRWGTGQEAVACPMAGSVLEFRAQEGDVVGAGDALIVISAMKMESQVSAPCDGTVAAVQPLSAGDSVEAGQVFAVIEPKAGAERPPRRRWRRYLVVLAGGRRHDAVVGARAPRAGLGRPGCGTTAEPGQADLPRTHRSPARRRLLS